MINKIIKHVKKRTLIVLLISKFNALIILNIFKRPHLYNFIEYKIKFGFLESIKKPKTFSQKIYYLRDKYDRSTLASTVADKFRVRQYVINMGLKSILNELIGVYDSPKEIDFDLLPSNFIIKTNHSCGTNIIVRDKNDIDYDEVKKQLYKWLKFNYAYIAGEMQYKNILPKIIIEKYLSNDNNEVVELQDYQFWCFNGEPKFINTHLYLEDGDLKRVQRFSFDLDFKKNQVMRLPENCHIDIKKPESLKKMIEYSRIISKPFKFARVDFYDIAGKAILGEITLTPSAGNNDYIGQKYQIIYGNELKLGDIANVNRKTL